MPEIFDDAALDLLQGQQRTINLTINDMVAYRNYGERFTPSEKANLISGIKSSAAKGGVDLTDWLGSRGVDAPDGGPP